MEQDGVRGLNAHAYGQAGECILSNTRGSVSVKTIVWLVILAIASYAGYLLLPPTVKYVMLSTEAGNEARLAHMYPDERLAERILEKAEGWSMPLEEGDIRISRGDSDITISISYIAEINVLGVYKTGMNYRVNVSAPLKQ